MSVTDGGQIENFHIGEDGKPYITYKVGADAVTKKLGSGNFEKITVLEKCVVYAGSSTTHTFSKDYDLVIAVSQGSNPHSSYARPNANILTDVSQKLLLDNNWDGNKYGQTCAIGILMDVKAGNTVTVGGNPVSSYLIFAVE